MSLTLLRNIFLAFVFTSSAARAADRVQASTSLTNDWTTILTTNTPSGVIDVINADAPNQPYCFYRTVAVAGGALNSEQNYLPDFENMN